MSNLIIEKLKEKGYYAEMTRTSKNGIEQTGIIIGKSSVRGIIYPDMSLAIDDCVEDIIRTYESTKIPKTVLFRTNLSINIIHQKVQKINVFLQKRQYFVKFLKVHFLGQMGH